MQTRSRLKDIAQNLKLDVSTVSRGLRGSQRVKPDTREIILAEAERLSFHPNLLARSLVKKASNLILYLTANFREYEADLPAAAMSRTLAGYGYTLLLGLHFNKSDIFIHLLVSFRQGAFNGLIITPSREDEALKKRIAACADLPVIFMDRHYKNIRGTIVTSDNAQGVALLVNELKNEKCSAVIDLFTEQTSVQAVRADALHSLCKKKYRIYFNIADCTEEGKTVAIFSSSQGRIRRALQNYPLLAKRNRILAMTFDAWDYEHPSVAGAYYCLQDLEKMGETAAELLLEQIQGKRKIGRNYMRRIPVLGIRQYGA